MYEIKYGNRYLTFTDKSDNANLTGKEMENIVLTALNKNMDKARNEKGYLPEDWYNSIFFNYIEKSDGLGNKLKPCPFCGNKMVFIKEMHRNKKAEHIYVSQYYLHEDSNKDCILDEIMTPFSIGAGDAKPEKNDIGELGLKWNQRIENK